MFQYTKEFIINSWKDADADAYGTTLTKDRVESTAGFLRILRAGEYRAEFVQDGVVYKTPGVIGKTANVVFDMANADLTTYKHGVYRLSIWIQMNNKYLGDYANAAWLPFAKPLMVEVEMATGDTPAIMAKKLADAIELAVPYNNIFARVTVSGTTVTVDLTDAYAHIEDARLEYYDPRTCDSCVAGTYYAVAFEKTIKNNVEPFATGRWIQENLRFPTYPNLRDAALYEDEYPVKGELYTQYSFAYDVPRIGYYGISGVNQKMEAVTRHIYYVLNTFVDQFDAALEEAFGENVIVTANSARILTGGSITKEADPIALVSEVNPSYAGDSTLTFNYTIAAGTGANPSTTGIVMDPANGVDTGAGVTIEATTDSTVGQTFTVTATPVLTPPDANGITYAPITKKFTVAQAQ